MKMALGGIAGISQDLQLICKCCGQAYSSVKCWEDQLDAVMQGQERFAICPICTQAPPLKVLHSQKYKRRCVSEVKRLQGLWEQNHSTNANARPKESLKSLLERLNEAVIAGRISPQEARETLLRFIRLRKAGSSSTR